MSLHDVSNEEKIELLKSWREEVQKDIDVYQGLVDKQVKRKKDIEEKAAKKLRPILKKISIFQKFVDSFTNKKNKINEEIEKIQKDLNQ